MAIPAHVEYCYVGHSSLAFTCLYLPVGKINITGRDCSSITEARPVASYYLVYTPRRLIVRSELIENRVEIEIEKLMTRNPDYLTR